MKSLINDIEIGGVRDALDILAKAGDEELFEKAKHQIGDSHPTWPQLKWTDLGNGKFGWRTGTGRGKRANTSSGGNGGSAGNSGGNAGQANAGNIKVRKDLPQITHGGDSKKDAEAHNRADSMLKYEGFTIGKDNLYHHKDGRTIRINPKTGYYEESIDSKNQAKPAKTNTTEKKEEKKLRPVGTGTNGPERRKKTTSKETTKTKKNSLGKIFKMGDAVQYQRKSGAPITGQIIDIDKDGRYVQVRNQSTHDIDYVPINALDEPKPYQ